ncbi:MAG: NADH-quinone oxidoreductase subunit N [Parahaliea sp.]
MTLVDLQALLPLTILGAGSLVVMLQIALIRRPVITVSLTVLTLLLAAASACRGGVVTQVTPLLLSDAYARLFTVLFCLAGVVTTLLSTGYLSQRGDEPEDFYLLLILSTLGACVLAFATHLASLLLGLELLSVALYALIAYPNKALLPLEAATKYLVLSGAASATTLFGFALLYAATGTLSFDAMGKALAASDELRLLEAAAVMVVAGLAFKLSLTPFHLWTPDVYQGAPAPVTGFLATVSKAAVLVVLLRWFDLGGLLRYPDLVQVMAVLAILSMLAGNLLALRQDNIKRMLAYSSIAHMGYLLIVFAAASVAGSHSFALEAAAFYLVAYTATTLAAFAPLAMMSAGQGGGERCLLQDLSGLFWRAPGAALLMLLAMLSLAGIPLTAGFLAKFYLVGAASGSGHWLLLGSLVVGSAIGIYYYLRVVFTMSRRPGDNPGAPEMNGHWPPRLATWLLAAAILWLGILPQQLLHHLASIL